MDNIFFNQYTFDELLEMLKNKYEWLKLHKERVEKENEEHRNKTYEIGYVSKLREENKRLKEDYYRGFPISKEEKEAINKWADKHYKTCPHKRAGYSYRFYPTPLGVSGSVQCLCGTKFEFQEIG
jgi:hypothetical protein